MQCTVSYSTHASAPLFRRSSTGDSDVSSAALEALFTSSRETGLLAALGPFDLLSTGQCPAATEKCPTGFVMERTRDCEVIVASPLPAASPEPGDEVWTYSPPLPATSAKSPPPPSPVFWPWRRSPPSPSSVARPDRVRGCTDREASNYNSDATVAASMFDVDRSCTYLTAAGREVGSWYRSRTPGCWDSTAVNYNARSTLDGGRAVCVFITFGCMASADRAFKSDATHHDPRACVDTVGCADSDAFNYMRHATINAPAGDRRACKQMGCTHSTHSKYNPKATHSDFSCSVELICPDETATNYKSSEFARAKEESFNARFPSTFLNWRKPTLEVSGVEP